MNRRELLGAISSAGLGLTLGGQTCQAHDHGEGKSEGPVGSSHAHLCGIHIVKSDPKIQLIVQHYCAAHAGTGPDDQLFQCLLFDSSAKNAKLMGVEYIISDAQYRKLPEKEKMYWHPHSYEVLAGGLIAPGMDPEAEKKFMGSLLTTWGKTWHTWPDPTTPIPMGEPILIWSLTADGQADEKVIAERDKQFSVETAKIREQRIAQIGYDVPKVSLPNSVETVGRQWTDSGDDKPTPKK